MWRSEQLTDTAIVLRSENAQDEIKPNLPEPPKLQDVSDEVESFAEQISGIYEEAVHWRPNLMKVPTNGIGKQFVRELSTWLEHFNDDTPYHCIAMKTFMILPALVLQKPCSKIKSSEYSDLLNKRMGWWRDRDFTSLIRQARTIQSQVNKKSSRKKKPDTARVFANLMFEGKVSAAIRMLCDEDNRGVLELSEETKAELMKKHPPPAPIKCDSLLCGPLLQIDEIYFSKIDSEIIARSAKMTRGSAGPTQTDAYFFRHIFTHRNFNIEERNYGNKLLTSLDVFQLVFIILKLSTHMLTVGSFQLISVQESDQLEWERRLDE